MRCPELDVAVDRPQQQVAFASERGVKARSAQAGGAAQIVERRRFVALAPKGLHRAVERVIEVEFAGNGPFRSVSHSEHEYSQSFADFIG
jgi:hypothetical protein